MVFDLSTSADFAGPITITLPIAAGAFRHPDHRFEWSRAEFEAWTAKISETYSYAAAISGIGDVDASFGAPTQMAVFTR